jgi:hypothetical protein
LAAQALYRDINACQNPDQLHAMTKLVWERNYASLLNDGEASYLGSCIERRKPVSQRTKAGKFALAPLNSRLSRFAPRQRPRCPNRQASRERRRCLGGSSNTLRRHYTEGQRAVLCIIAGEIKHHGVCDLPISKIAALAGVCRTTVQTTLHEARRLSHIRITERPVPGRKHKPNLIEIASPEWRTWVKRGPSAHRTIGSKTVNLVSPTKSKYLNKEEKVQGERKQEAIQGVPWSGSGPPGAQRGWRYGK